MKMQLNGGIGNMKHYVCELTKELDVLSEMDKQKFYDWLHHYILVDEASIRERLLPIRVPGGTVGSLSFDENDIITRVEVDTNYVVKTYTDNVNEIIQKYVGQKIEH